MGIISNETNMGRRMGESPKAFSTR